MVVNDSSGAPITNLQQQDFTILDNKRPQTIVSFEPPSANKAADVVIVLDAVNIAFTRLAFAREQLEKFLRQDEGRLSYPVALGVFTDSGLAIEPKLSQDGNALAAYLEGKDIGLRTNNRSQGFYGAADRTQMSIRALQQLVAFENSRPGRKVVVWVSPGWPLLSGPRVQMSRKDTLSLFNTIVEISTDLARSGVTLYSVDPLGTTDGIRSLYYEDFLKPITAPNQLRIGNLALQVIAVHSGGRAMTASNDVAGLVERCVRDAGDAYRLTYEMPPSGDKANEYHSIEIKLDQPHLKAQTLAGYYARPQSISEQ